MRISFLVIGSIIVAAGCGGDSSSAGSSPTAPTGTTTNPVGSNQVSIAGSSFSPGTLTVSPGTTVTWQWNDCPGGAGGYGVCTSHNVTFDDGSNVASATQETGTFSRTFNSAGTYTYHCTIHGAAAMNGQIVVK